MYNNKLYIYSMDIVIANTSPYPIYEQIKTQIRAAIISDQVQEGDVLPSIRQLAQDLKISVITTTRAYNDLEAEGYIATVQGRGCFVLPKNKEYIKEQKLKKIEQHFSEAILDAKLINLPEEELVQMLKILIKEEK